jgi:hypothetical protein
MRGGIEIDRPRREVFAIAGDPMRDIGWRLELRRMTGGPPKTGAVYAEVLDVGTGIHTTETVVTAFDPPHEIVLRALAGQDFEVRRSFAALAGGRTRLSYELQASAATIRAIFGEPVDPALAAAVIQSVMQANLTRLKRRLERAG